MGRPKRKIVLFLVEGKSDREALRLAISELYEKIDKDIEVFFPMIHADEKERGGDITTGQYTDQRGRTRWVSSDNYEDAMFLLFLKDFFDEMKIMSKDVSEVIQVVDLDGAYIPDDRILHSADLTDAKRVRYTEENIECIDVRNIVRRNEQKREILDNLSARTKIKVKTKAVPYSIYYFSSNLDHFLYDEANLDPRDKVVYADAFSSEYIGDVDGFIKRIADTPGTCNGMTYEESWQFIKEDINSLERHTNLNILFNKLLSEGEQVNVTEDDPAGTE